MLANKPAQQMPALRHRKADCEDELIAKGAVIYGACSGYVLARERDRPAAVRVGIVPAASKLARSLRLPARPLAPHRGIGRS